MCLIVLRKANDSSLLSKLKQSSMNLQYVNLRSSLTWIIIIYNWKGGKIFFGIRILNILHMTCTANFFLCFYSLNPDPTQRLSIWSLIIGGAFGLFPLWAVNQTAVQRFLAAKSNKEAKL